jgi:hypothetical protein
METKQFLDTVLSDEGYYCVVGIKNGRTVQKFYSSLDSIAETATSLDVDGCDTYFALSTFIENTSRKAENVRYIKALFLDLDCGQDKPYSTQTNALTALSSFCKHYKLPTPTIAVNSGRGVHIYWVLNRPHSRKEWLPIAERLKAACTEYKLNADPVVTADAARILRIPNTHNFKSSSALAVKVIWKLDTTIDLETFAAKLPPLLMPVLPAKSYSATDKQDMKQAMGESNYVKKFPRLLEMTLRGSGCNQIHKAVMKPNTLTYPEWLHVLSIAKHCEDGEEWAHKISSKYEGYNREETTNVTASIEAPHLCITFEKDNPAGCENCPHKGKIKTPIKLCVEIREAKSNTIEVTEGNVIELPKAKKAKVLIPDYPYPYFRGANGGVYLRTKDKEGNPDEILIYKRDLYPIQRLRDPMEGPCYLFRHHTKREGIQEFVVAGIKLSSREEFRKAMGMNDIFVLSKNQEALMNYIGRWISELQNAQDEIKVKTQFGWSDDESSFVIGDREVFVDRIVPNPPGGRTAQYFPAFRKKGTLEGWKRITKFYNRPNFEEHQFMFALSFGSPLMQFVPNIAGAIYHLTSSESGFGKTTGMWGGASVWGNHKRLVLHGKDTGNSVWNRAEIYKNIILYIDELSNYPPKEASDFAYAIGDGEQRNRQSNAGQNLERMRGEEWSLLCGTSANVSLLDKMSEYRALPKGEAQRVMEATVKKLLFTPEEALVARELNEDLVNNYGHAGEVFIQHVIQNIDTVRKLVNKNIEKIIVAAALTPQNRFWSAQTGVTYTGALIAQHLGLIDWDLDALYRWIIQKLKRMKHDMKDMDIDIGDMVGQFYSDHPRGILRIKSTDDARGDSGVEHMILPDAQPLYRWVARHEYDVNKLYLLPKPFKEWCVKQGHHYSAIREMIFKELNGKTAKMRLGRGTKLNLPPQHVLELSWSYDEFTAKQQEVADLITVEDNDTSKTD